MDTLQKQFMRMIGYSAIGVISGGVIGTIFGALVNVLYSFSNRTAIDDTSVMYNALAPVMLFNPTYSIISGIIGGVLAAVYVMRASKNDEQLNNLRKSFAMLVGYSALGMIFGGLIAVLYALILVVVYHIILKLFTYADTMLLLRTPFLPLIGGMFGAILTGILVIKMSKSEKKV